MRRGGAMSLGYPGGLHSTDCCSQVARASAGERWLEHVLLCSTIRVNFFQLLGELPGAHLDIVH